MNLLLPAAAIIIVVVNYRESESYFEASVAFIKSSLLIKAVAISVMITVCESVYIIIAIIVFILITIVRVSVVAKIFRQACGG